MIRPLKNRRSSSNIVLQSPKVQMKHSMFLTQSPSLSNTPKLKNSPNFDHNDPLCLIKRRNTIEGSICQDNNEDEDQVLRNDFENEAIQESDIFLNEFMPRLAAEREIGSNSVIIFERRLMIEQMYRMQIAQSTKASQIVKLRKKHQREIEICKVPSEEERIQQMQEKEAQELLKQQRMQKVSQTQLQLEMFLKEKQLDALTYKEETQKAKFKAEIEAKMSIEQEQTRQKRLLKAREQILLQQIESLFNIKQTPLLNYKPLLELIQPLKTTVNFRTSKQELQSLQQMASTEATHLQNAVKLLLNDQLQQNNNSVQLQILQEVLETYQMVIQKTLDREFLMNSTKYVDEVIRSINIGVVESDEQHLKKFVNQLIEESKNNEQNFVSVMKELRSSGNIDIDVSKLIDVERAFQKEVVVSKNIKEVHEVKNKYDYKKDQLQKVE
ncbi:Conserved_hypothetical protein [Hexamita inflata]|uniref:Uncharacterized protein n=1 Tax=Hexamita inflata TaxID=28002 RepID=A0AA86Q115_9EUKA|nr:Conserved hypothetical protein [Hexamita inflata]